MNVVIDFFVEGIPRAQGNHRTAKSGHIYETTKGHKAWRTAVYLVALSDAMRAHREPIEGPVYLVLDFFMPRAKSNKDPHHVKKPDLSKLIRAVEDSLSRVCFKDDSQVVEIRARKIYSSDLTGVRVRAYAEEQQ